MRVPNCMSSDISIFFSFCCELNRLYRCDISLGQLLDYIATVSVLGELDELSDGGLVAKRDAPAIRERLSAHAATAREHMMVNE